jgi:Caspase domain
MNYSNSIPNWLHLITYYLVAMAASHTANASQTILQPGPGNGKDIWTTSVFSYAPGPNTPGGGANDFQLRVGGWGDLYQTLLQFNINTLPQLASSATVRLYCIPDTVFQPTRIFLDRITAPWDWRTSGTGRDRDRLWWFDRPSSTQWLPASLPPAARGAWYEIDITDLYNQWKDGSLPNYGIQLRPASFNNNNIERFYSSDDTDHPTLRPQLVVHTAEYKPKMFGICIGQHEDKYFFPDTIRGDKGAQAVFDRLSKSPSWAGSALGNTSSPVIFEETFQPGVAEDVIIKIQSMQVREGDTFVFYFNGHCGPVQRPGAANDETPVVIDGQSNSQDELLSINLSDDDIYSLFSAPKWQLVRKVFLLDACYSGGFLGSSASDLGDLEKLSNCAVFASASETTTAAAVPIYRDLDLGGMGIWTKEFLLPALDSGPVSANQLQSYLLSNLTSVAQAYQGMVCPLLDLYTAGSSINFNGLSPTYQHTSTFDESKSILVLPVPNLSIIAQANSMGLVWRTEVGIGYQLQKSTNLRDWEPVGSEVFGNNGYFQKDEPTSLGGCFYRLSYRLKP